MWYDDHFRGIPQTTKKIEDRSRQMCPTLGAKKVFRGFRDSPKTKKKEKQSVELFRVSSF